MLWHDASWGLPKQRDVIHPGKQSVAFSYISNKINENYETAVLNINYDGSYDGIIRTENPMNCSSDNILQHMFSCRGLLWKVWDQNQWGMEIIVLRALDHPYRCSSCTKLSEKLLTFSSVVSPRVTLIFFVLDGHLYHLQKVTEKRNSDIRGNRNLCERRQKKTTKETCIKRCLCLVRYYSLFSDKASLLQLVHE